MNARHLEVASDWGQPWALFNLAADRTELRDLSRQEPQRLKELTGLWDAWWKGKDQGFLKASGGEPSYRRMADQTESTQGGEVTKRARAKAKAGSSRENRATP